MEIKARQKGTVIILDLLGRVDVNSANLVEVVGQCLRDGYCDILCNFEDVAYIDYMGISAIVLAYKETINSNGRMKFVNVPSHLKNMLSLTGLDRVIDMCASEDEALNAFKEDKIIEHIKKMQLRRRFKRLPIDIKVELKNKSQDTLPCMKVDIINLSGVGAYIYGCNNFKLGDEVILKFKLPPKYVEVELEAKVVWIPDKQIQIHVSPGMGVEFYKIPSQVQELLLEFIERNLSLMSSDE
jgi:anti-anti-sigma factor